CLPGSEQVPGLLPSECSAVEAPQQKAAGHILLVDDDEKVAATVAQMLEQLGYQVSRCASAAAALEWLENGGRANLVFSDVMMPGGMNGVELAREIRLRQFGIPVLLKIGRASCRERV